MFTLNQLRLLVPMGKQGPSKENVNEEAPFLTGSLCEPVDVLLCNTAHMKQSLAIAFSLIFSLKPWQTAKRLPARRPICVST